MDSSSVPRARQDFRFTLYSSLCVVSGARWLQVLDGMRRQRAAYVRVPTDALRARFRGVAFFMSGGNSQGDESSHQESGLSAAPKSSRRPRLERRRLRGAAVRRRHLLREAAASDRPPTARSASGGGMFGAHGNIAYLSLPCCALMRASSARAAAAR